MTKKQYLYQTIYNNLYKKIKAGEYAAGDKLPSEKELSEQFGVSRITTKKALNMLTEEGIIQRYPGLGSFVCSSKLPDSNMKNSTLNNNIVMQRKTIGLVMEDFSASYGLELLKYIEAEIEKLGWYLCIKRSLGDQLSEKKVIEELLELNVDGMIIMPTHGEHYNTEILRMVIEGFPVVFIDRFLSGIPAPFVGTNNFEASKILTNYLFENGHTNIGMITAPADDAITLKDRINGFKQAYKKANIDINKDNILDSIRGTLPNLRTEKNTEMDIKRIRNFLENNKDITAVIANEYDIAILFKNVCKDMGIRIPEDLSVVCFDNPKSYYDDHYFTYMCQDEKAIGVTSVNILKQYFTNKPDKELTNPKLVNANLCLGSSVKNIKQNK